MSWLTWDFNGDLPDISASACAEFGQVQKIIFQKVYDSTTGARIGIAQPELKASWDSITTGDEKWVISPFVEAPEQTAAEPIRFGGGNVTRNGNTRVLGETPAMLDMVMYAKEQKVIAEIRQYMDVCPDIGVWLIDASGRFMCQVDDFDAPSIYFPIPIHSLFVGSKTLGGLENSDSNALSFEFEPFYSDTVTLVTPTDFNPLRDLTNA